MSQAPFSKQRSSWQTHYTKYINYTDFSVQECYKLEQLRNTLCTGLDMDHIIVHRKGIQNHPYIYTN